VNVAFAPTTSGPASGVLAIRDNIDGLSYSVSLSGTGSDFSVWPAAPSLAVVRGTSNSVAINVTSLGGPFQNSIALSCSGLPIKTSCALSPSSLVPGAVGGSSVLTISTDASAVQTGTYNIAVLGKSSTLYHSAMVQITITGKH